MSKFDEPRASGDRRPTIESSERDQFLAAMVDSADDAIFAKRLDGTILSWNTGAQAMYGYRGEEIVGQSVHRLAPPEHHHEIDQILTRLARGEHIRHFETERVRASGERFPVSLAISPVRGADGQIVGASTVARDITVERRLMDALSFQQSLLRAQGEAALDGILVIDPAGRLVYANRRFSDLWALPDETLATGSDAAILAHAAAVVDDPEAFLDRVRALYEDQAAVARDEIHLRDQRVIDRYTAPVIDERGRFRGRLWSFRDITAETIHLAQLRAVMAAITDAAIVFDREGHVALRNEAAGRLVPTIEDLSDLPVASEPHGEASEDDRDLSEVELLVDGTPRRFVVSRLPVAAASGREPGQARAGGDAGAGGAGAAGDAGLGTLVILHDVTELREVTASREALVGLLSHELRTPVTTIYGGTKLLGRGTLVGPAQRELLSDIEAESDRLYRLVEDLLVLTRIEREGLDIPSEPVRVAPIVRRVVAAEGSRVPDAIVTMDIRPDLPMVGGEETYVEQIVRNLVGNALKYGPRGGHVQLIAEPAGDGVAIRVLDSGPGIGADELERIFELLYRSPATKTTTSGSGIGLFISRRLARAMGGDLVAVTRPSGGSEFLLTLAPYEESD